MEKLYCSVCGSSEVTYRAWVDANTKEYQCAASWPLEEEDCWCENCEEHIKLKTLQELWEDFSEVPVNEDDEIEQGFLDFEAGTSKLDVWHWFDERCPNGLAVDLMGETSKYPKK